jgi:hypothetical protein
MLASACLLREDYAGVKEYCRQVSIYNRRGKTSSFHPVYHLSTRMLILPEADVEPRVYEAGVDTHAFVCVSVAQAMELIGADARCPQTSHDLSQHRLIFLGLLGSAAERQGDDVLAESYDQQIEKVYTEASCYPTPSHCTYCHLPPSVHTAWKSDTVIDDRDRMCPLCPQLASESEAVTTPLENGVYMHDILIFPTYRRRLRQLLSEYERTPSG